MNKADKIAFVVVTVFVSFFIILIATLVWSDIKTEEYERSMGISDNINESIEELRKSTQKEYDEITELVCDPGLEHALDNEKYDLLAKLTNLESITIRGITDRDTAQLIFKELAKLPKLRFVEITHSEVGTIAELANIKNLSGLSLDMGSGEWFKIDDFDSLGTTGSFLNLKSIMIDNAGMDELPDLSALSELNSLTINEYNITELNYERVNWSQLVNLNIAYTSISEIDDRIVSKLYNLESLDISYSDIRDIRFVLELPKLNSFSCRQMEDFSIDMKTIQAHPNFASF